MLRRCLQLHLSLIVLADQTPRKAWPFRPPPGDGFGLDGDPVSEGLLLMDVSLIVAERGVQIVARQNLPPFHPGPIFSSEAVRGTRWASLVALRITVVERLLELPAVSPIARPGAHGMLVCDPAAWLRAASLLQAA